MTALLIAALLAQISGAVLQRTGDAIQPLAGARVELLDGPTREVVRTDAFGRFVFQGVQPGSYRLLALHDGFVRQEFGQRLPNGPSSRVEVTASKYVENLVFLMQPAPTITGRVLDNYGEGEPGVLIEAFRKGYDARGNRTVLPIASTITDDRGQYRLYWLDPGDYIVRAGTASTESAYSATYYPGVADAGVAQSIPLGDREIDGVDFKIERGAPASVEGLITHPDGTPLSASVVLRPPGDIANPLRYAVEATPRGRSLIGFGIANLAPGTYIASATQTVDGQRYSGHTTIVLRGGVGSPYRLQLNLSPNVDLKGSVRMDAGGRVMDLSKTQIRLTSIEPVLPSPAPVAIGRDDGFVVRDIAAGDYSVSVTGLPGNVYLKDAPDVIEVNPAVSLPRLNIVFGMNGGSIEGAVRDVAGHSRFGAQVTLIPEGDRQNRSDQYGVAISDLDGHFLLRGIPPGNYKLFAWEALEPNANLNADFVRSFVDRSVNVRVVAGQKLLIDLSMIPAAP